MTDDKTNRGSPDNKRIDKNDPSEVRNWCKSFNCTKQELFDAIDAVGTSAKRVKEYLKK